MAKMKITVSFGYYDTVVNKITKEDIKTRDQVCQLVNLLMEALDYDAIVEKDPCEVLDLLDRSDNRPKHTYQVSGILQHRYKVNSLDDFVKLNEEDISGMEFGPKTKEALIEILTETKEKMGV
jgi:hypothetical protein